MGPSKLFTLPNGKKSKDIPDFELHCIPVCVRLRFFNQLEDELQSHQHEEQWLRDKADQLAQRDAELAGQALKEIGLLQTTWEDTKRLITERYCGDVFARPNYDTRGNITHS